MTQQHPAPPFSDETLVAYLDNEISAEQRRQIEEQVSRDPRLAARLAHLDSASLPFGAAYAGLLEQAPVARLKAGLATLYAGSSPLPASSARGNGVSRRQLIAAVIACLAVGGVAGRLSAGLGEGEAPEGNWRGLVAQYMSLYTNETFADMPESMALQHRQLRTIGAKLGLALEPSRLSLPGIELKFARMLRYDSQPIAQIAYLDPSHGPLAFCITTADRAVNRGAQSEVRLEMNVVYWSAQKHHFMLIGHNPAAEMRTLAQKLMLG
ncbi:anti-sigma factor family protein [Sodalis sp. C49]|uniref:anti-sigma factor family protein n=1 Tax=Sodalis sp. C49 TaxID=3228929 RepID=UPI0039658FB6